MEEWRIIWEAKDLFFNSFVTTIELFLSSSILAFIAGLILLYLINGETSYFRKSLNGLINLLRAFPFLILVYLIYYGLPQYDISFDAFTTGIIALALYHGAYFCEIFRSRLLVLPKGHVEAAQAHGFRRITIYFRIILPNVVMSSLPLIANQFILCLKDTAFLSIITLKDITYAANNIQSIHFIPFKAFIVAIGLYWLISISVEFLIKQLDLFGQRRGFSHAG